MKKTVLFAILACFVSCNKKQISDLECPCTLIAKQEPIYTFSESNLGEVVIEDKHGKLHTFTFQDKGVASLKNQLVGYKFGGNQTAISPVPKDSIQ